MIQIIPNELQEQITDRKEYKTFLEGLKIIPLNDFINKIKTFIEDKEHSYFKEIEEYIKQEISQEILNILFQEEFIKIFYLDAQAKYIKDKLNLSQDLDIIKTFVFCHNTNKREFKEREEERILKDRLLSEGFKEQNILSLDEEEDKRINEELKRLDGLKVICVMDISKIGLLGSFDKKEEIKGKLTYSDYHNALMLIPQRCRTRGHIIRKKFYYKENN